MGDSLHKLNNKKKMEDSDENTYDDKYKQERKRKNEKKNEKVETCVKKDKKEETCAKKNEKEKRKKEKHDKSEVQEKEEHGSKKKKHAYKKKKDKKEKKCDVLPPEYLKSFPESVWRTGNPRHKYCSIECKECVFVYACFIESIRQRQMNRKCLRIRNLLMFDDEEEDTKAVVCELINSALFLDLNQSQIINCVRVPRWDHNTASYPPDILVTFVSVALREAVFRGREEIQGDGVITICENLGLQSAAIFKRAVQVFSEDNVRIMDGVVHIIWGGNLRPMYTLFQYNEFVNRIPHISFVSK